MEDRWQLVISDDDLGLSKKVKVPMIGMKVKCPSCHHKFYVEDQALTEGEPR